MSVSDKIKIQGYGWHRSLPDLRDIVADTSEIEVKPEVDPRADYMTPVYNQGQLGSCTANAIAAAVDAWLIVQGEDPIYPSRLAIYYLERMVAGLPVNDDTGAWGRDGFKVSKKYGLIPEKDIPYDISKFTTDPRPRMKEEAVSVKLQSPYKSVRRSVTDWKRVFSNKQTIAFGFTVYSSFESAAVARTGVVPHPTPTEKILGGHEVLAVGYLSKYPDHVLCRNSWDTDWGIKGYFLMPWTMILDPNISDDFRTIYRPLAK